MLEGSLLIIYAALFLWGMSRWRFFTESGLNQWQLRIAFGLKILGAIAYGLVHWHYYGGGDTWAYLQYAKHIFYETLPHEPLHFLELVFLPNARTPPPYLQDIIAPIVGWSDVRTYTMYRVNALMLFFSGGGYYYVHAVFFAFLSMTGLVGIYRALFQHTSIEPQIKPNVSNQMWGNWAYGALFCIPSVVFWGSGVHKEALTLFCLGMILYHIMPIPRFWMYWQKIGIMLTCCLLLALMRPYVLALLLPALLAWYLAPLANKRWQLPLVITYLAVYGTGMLLVTLLPVLQNNWNILAKIQAIQYVFVVYESGGSDVYLPLIEVPTWWEVMKVLPYALYNTTFRVLWLDTHSTLRLFAALETVVLFGLLLWILGRSKHLMFHFYKTKLEMRQKNSSNTIKWVNVAYFCFFFGVSYLLLIGILVGNIGALVRYRITPSLFLCLTLLFFYKCVQKKYPINI